MTLYRPIFDALNAYLLELGGGRMLTPEELAPILDRWRGELPVESAYLGDGAFAKDGADGAAAKEARGRFERVLSNVRRLLDKDDLGRANGGGARARALSRAVSGGGDTLRAARASRFVCRPRKAPYPGTQRVDFTLVKSGQGGARIGLVASNRELNNENYPNFYPGVNWQMDRPDHVEIDEQRTWLFDTESGGVIHSDPRIPIGPCVTDRPWGHVGGTGFVKEGSVVGMELQRTGENSIVTLTIYIDGRRLGELVTSEDHGIIAPIPDYSRDVRWCGVVSAGAELRIDGPKPPMSA